MTIKIEKSADPPLWGVDAQTSTNAYVTELEVYCYPWVNKGIWIRENNVNSIDYSIDFTIDGTNWENLTTDNALFNDNAFHTLTDTVVKLRVQIKSTAAGTHSTDVDVYIAVNG